MEAPPTQFPVCPHAAATYPYPSFGSYTTTYPHPPPASAYTAATGTTPTGHLPVPVFSYHQPFHFVPPTFPYAAPLPSAYPSATGPTPTGHFPDPALAPGVSPAPAFPYAASFPAPADAITYPYHAAPNSSTPSEPIFPTPTSPPARTPATALPSRPDRIPSAPLLAESSSPTLLTTSWPPPAPDPTPTIHLPYSLVHAPPAELTAPSNPSLATIGAPGSIPPNAQPCAAFSPRPGLHRVQFFLPNHASSLNLQDSELDALQRHSTGIYLDRLPSSSNTNKNDATVQEVTDERVTPHRLQQQQREQIFNDIQGQLAKLTAMASQLAVSIGKRSVSAPRSTPAASAAVPACAVSQVTNGTAPGHHNPIKNSCVSTNISDERQQQYSFHNLNHHSVFLADGSKHSYFALPENYPLERAVPEPVFDVYADKTNDCSNVFGDVFASTSEKQPYEEEQQEGEQLFKCFSKEPKTEHTSACLNIISDVRELSLELQQQHDERACNCPVIKASDSSATRSSQLSVKHSMSELRMLWDPGASVSLHSSKANLCNQVDTYGSSTDLAKFSVPMMQNAIQRLRFVFAINTSSLCNLELMANTSSKVAAFIWHTSVTGTPFILRSSTTYTWDPGVLNILEMMLDKCIVPNKVQFIQRTTEISFLSLTACMQYMVPNGINSVAHDTSFIMPRAAHFSHGQMVNVLSHWFPSFEMATLQWDPGIQTSSSIYLWLQGLTVRIATEKSFSCLSIPELTKWQCQVASASFVWDLGTMFPWYKPKWWFLFIEEKISGHNNIKFYGILLFG